MKLNTQAKKCLKQSVAESGEKKAVAEGHLDVTTKELKSDELKVLAKAKKIISDQSFATEKGANWDH